MLDTELREQGAGASTPAPVQHRQNPPTVRFCSEIASHFGLHGDTMEGDSHGLSPG